MHVSRPTISSVPIVLMQQRPIRVLFLDPFRLAVSFRQYLQRVTLNAKFHLLPWSHQKHLIYEFCGTAMADEQLCEFSEYAGLALPVHWHPFGRYAYLLKNVKFHRQELHVQNQLTAMDAVFRQVAARNLDGSTQFLPHYRWIEDSKVSPHLHICSMHLMSPSSTR